jgi:murein DD-endopeptidase MepM/ murein hydrolase activator NlpD
VPKPRGEAAELAKSLGLGNRNTCSLLLLKAPSASWIEAAQRAGAASTWLWPIEHSRLLRGVGNERAAEKRRDAQFAHKKKPGSSRRHPHEGLDIAASEGAPIHAAQNGLVVYSDNKLTGYGNALLVVHKDGSVALYAHCRATYVFAGQIIEQGQIIAELGHTGYARGPHLHFEYRVDGRARDPSGLFAPHD